MRVANVLAEPLRHPGRAKAERFVHAHPGATFSDIMRHMGWAIGQTSHHMYILARSGRIARVRTGRRTRYAPPGPESAAAAWGAHEPIRRVLDQADADGYLRTGRIGRALGVTRQSVAYSIQRAVRAGLVTPAGYGVWRLAMGGE